MNKQGISRELLTRLKNAANQAEVDVMCWAYIEEAPSTHAGSCRTIRLFNSGYILKGITFETPEARS